MTGDRDCLSRRQFIGIGAAGAATLALRGMSSFATARRKQPLTHRERIAKALALEETDRMPFGFWWHFPNQDRSPRRLARLSLELQQKLDTDFIKFSPYGLYSVVDWGVVLDVRGGRETPVEGEYPIHGPEDWRSLRRIRPDEGEYLIVLEAQRIALSDRSVDVPLVQTVFSPLTSCLKMAGREILLEHIRERPDAVHAGLEIITETTLGFALEAVARGADGLFFATQTANEGYLTGKEYDDFVKRYDLAVLEAVREKSWFNILHLHGQDVMFDHVLDYPVQAFNYHDRESGPALADLRSRTNKILIGGIAENTTLVEGAPEEVDAEVREAWDQVNRRGLILGPGCVANLDAPETNVLQLRRSVESTAAL